MKPQQPSRKTGRIALTAVAALALASTMAWMSMRGGSAPAVTMHEAVHAAPPPVDTTAQAASTAHDDSPHATRQLPARQWKLGDSFVYQVQSTRQITVTKAAADAASSQQGG